MVERFQQGPGRAAPAVTPGADGRAAILNGFGRTLGDGIIGLQALAVALRAGAIPPRPALFRLPGLSPVLQQLYEVAADLAAVEELPWRDATPGELPDGATGFRTIFDLRDFAFDPAFRRVAMIDYFLRRLGLDPDAVPPAMKRNAWLAPRMRLQPSLHGSGYVLLCPRAAMEMRCMPLEVHDHIAGWLARNQARPVLTQATLPPETSLPDLCALVASADLVISTDTAMVHLADAFSRPCLAFFTTHRPEWRVRDYPLCRALHLPTGLPEALEFSRGREDVEQARRAWLSLLREPGLLDSALSDAAGRLGAA